MKIFNANPQDIKKILKRKGSYKKKPLEMGLFLDVLKSIVSSLLLSRHGYRLYISTYSCLLVMPTYQHLYCDRL